MAKALAIRMRVFVTEQGVPREIELDRDDDRAIHFLAMVGRKAVGTARGVRQGGSAKIGRMAVLKSYRGRGIGRKLLQRALVTAKKSEVRNRTHAVKDHSWRKRRRAGTGRKQGKKRSARTIYLHAQVPVIGFYEAMGFRCFGPIFNEAGIPHRKMVLRPQRKTGSVPPRGESTA